MTYVQKLTKVDWGSVVEDKEVKSSLVTLTMALLLGWPIKATIVWGLVLLIGWPLTWVQALVLVVLIDFLKA